MGDLQWADSPYSWWLVQADLRNRPEDFKGSRVNTTLHICLVEGMTGVLLGLRTVRLSDVLAQGLDSEIDRKSKDVLTMINAEVIVQQAVQRTYARYPASEDMLRDASALCVAID